MARTIRPLEDNVVVEKIQETKTQGGLYLPENQKDQPRIGKVLAVGPGRTNDDGATIPVKIQVGDTVVFADYSGVDIKVDGKKYRCIASKFVLGVVEGEAGDEEIKVDIVEAALADLATKGA